MGGVNKMIEVVENFEEFMGGVNHETSNRYPITGSNAEF